MLTRRRFLYLGGGALGALALAGPAQSAAGDISMRYPKWKTVCVGRYLVDVPAEARSKGEWFINDNKVQKLDCTPLQAREMVQERIARLKQTSHNSKGSMFIKTIPLPNDGIIIQGWALPNNVTSGKLYIYIASGKEIKQIYHLEVKFSLSKEHAVLRRYSEIGSSLRAIPSGSIPKESGYCMGDVLLLDTPSSRDESGWISFTLPDAPHLSLGMRTFIVQQRPNPLHAGELKKRCEQLTGVDCTALRNGPHPVGPLPGYEICVAGVNEAARYRVFTYLWYAPGQVQDNTNPAVRATMAYNRIPPLAASGPRPFGTDQESLVFWDKIVNSIRYRPVS
ncbi:hypothetical protein LJB82_01505 [Desulfovibrio sp. OttesenSCG-928-M16]|nr:hypothetical protein [Desulfovibrio sp. OttesenSCG-928-M16]